MLKRGHLAGLLLAISLFGVSAMVARTSPQTEPALHIDIPVKLDKANAVFDVGHLLMTGEMPWRQKPASRREIRRSTPAADSARGGRL